MTIFLKKVTKILRWNLRTTMLRRNSRELKFRKGSNDIISLRILAICTRSVITVGMQVLSDLSDIARVFVFAEPRRFVAGHTTITQLQLRVQLRSPSNNNETVTPTASFFPAVRRLNANNYLLAAVANASHARASPSRGLQIEFQPETCHVQSCRPFLWASFPPSLCP